MDARIFARFHVDVGVGDVLIQPLEAVECGDWLEFAGVERPIVRTIPREQQIAERFHAYTLPRSKPNSRVKDLVDLVLLIRSAGISGERVADALRIKFEQRKTHAIPLRLQPPPRTGMAALGPWPANAGCHSELRVPSGRSVHSSIKYRREIPGGKIPSWMAERRQIPKLTQLWRSVSGCEKRTPAFGGSCPLMAYPSQTRRKQ
jgi:hypothetical protein